MAGSAEEPKSCVDTILTASLEGLAPKENQTATGRIVSGRAQRKSQKKSSAIPLHYNSLDAARLVAFNDTSLLQLAEVDLHPEDREDTEKR